MTTHDEEDDLFKHTSMTFGEHLEELRACLLKAVLSLAIGFGIGLWFAPKIVQWIQSPLEGALENYYSAEAVEYIDKHLPPEMRENEEIRKQAREIVFTEGLIPQEAYVAPGELLGELKKKYPQTFDKIALPADSDGANKPALAKGDLLKIFLWKPLSDDDRLKLKAMNVQESFMIYIKAALLAGAILSSPAVFYFLWSFVAAGLYPHEKRYIHTFLPVSVLLFISGAALAFTLVFPPVLAFFFSITKSMGQELEPRISEWLSFVLLLPLGFGVSFQLPLIMLFLERIHIFDVKTYLSKWRIAVLAMAIASMVLSPGGDPYSMLMMLVPLIGLYFGGIALCKWMPSPGRKMRSPEKALAERK
jgi:sec-independent protein translocase protein TatC